MNKGVQKNKDNNLEVNNKQFDSFQSLLTNNPPLSYNKAQTKKQNLTFIRLINTLPSKTNIAIYINRNQLIANLKYKDSTQYLTVLSGVHFIEIFKTDNLSKPIYSEQITLLAEQNYTIAIGNSVDQISLFSYMDNTTLPIGEAKIRFINLSPNSPNLDFAVKAGEGDVVFSNVTYRCASEYLPISPMTVNLEIRLSGTKNIIFPLYKTKFKENTVYDLISVGCVEEDPRFEVIKLF